MRLCVIIRTWMHRSNARTLFLLFENLQQKKKKNHCYVHMEVLGLLAKAIFHVAFHDQECFSWHLNSTPITYPRGPKPKKTIIRQGGILWVVKPLHNATTLELSTIQYVFILLLLVVTHVRNKSSSKGKSNELDYFTSDF